MNGIYSLVIDPCGTRRSGATTGSAGVRYPLAVGTDDVKQKFGGIEGLPTTMLYDRHGILRTKVVGFEYTENIESGLKPLL